jgi:alkanesulfonate monooxygenase SsuD/methylene tetrahydromethanopterin reductase-like flavin-dependent oxidoreductase (luciferase family)
LAERRPWPDGAAIPARRIDASVRFGLDVAQQRMSWDELVSRVRLAEELGFDGAWGFDHFQPLYGEGPGETFDGVTTLAALSGLTSRIRLGLLVTGVTYRHPSVFATEMVTIDHASNGRLEMSLGAAWYDKEHTELGIPFPPTGRRFDLLEDALEITTRLMTGERVSYEGTVVSLRDAQVLPRPVQRPHPPIWIGGDGPRRTLPLVARFADAWHTWGTPPRPGVIPPRSCGPRRCRSTTSTRPAARRSSGATPGTATWCATGRTLAGRRSRPSPGT